MMPLVCEASPAVTALTSALGGIVTDMTSAVTSVAPLAIPVIGAGLVITVGIKVFKRVSGKI